jgi:hypothetical protein
MAVVDDLKRELAAARSERQGYENDWRDYVDYTAPDLDRAFNSVAGVQVSGMAAWKRSAARERSRRLYDGTAVWLLDRLVSGIESLTMPKGFNWHGIGFDDPFAAEPTPEELEYFELLRDHLFRIRYSDKSGFALANRSSLVSTVKLGTGVLFPAENEEQLASIRTPVFYRYVPLHEVYLVVDAQGNDCGFFRVRSLKAWQAAKEYDGKLSEKVKADAEDASRRTNDHVFVHACVRREGGYLGAADVKRSLYESIHFEQDSGHICRQGGFFEYPLVVRRWDRDGLSPYGSPPQAKMMGDIKSLQSLVKDSLVASAQAVRPPLATHKNERPLDLNPGRVNPGLIDEQGRRLYGAMIDTVNPGAAFGEIDRIREALRLGLYGDLWQTLLDGNGRTATEATIRAQEKADMIGPFTTNIQAGHGVLFDREIGILGRRGAFEQGSPLAPPQSVAETEISVRSTAPIDQMREAGHFEGLASFRQYLNGALQTNPEAADWLDEDEERKLAQRSLGLPQKLLRRPEEVEEIRAQRARQQAQQQQLAAGESLARMAKDGAPMAKLLAEQGGGSGAGLEEALAAAQAAGGGAPAGGTGGGNVA